MKTYKRTAAICLGLFASLSAIAIVMATVPENPGSSGNVTNTTQFSVGNVQNGSTEGQYSRGVPLYPVVGVFWDSPEAADTDQFFDDLDVATTGNLRPTTAMAKNATDAAWGGPIPRNVTVAFNQSTTGTMTITYIDANGTQQTSEAITRTGASTTYTSAWTAREIKYVTVSSAFTASTTVDVGCGAVFGLPNPMYAANSIRYDGDGALLGFVDADGADFPATTDIVTAVAGNPESDAADDYGTITFTDAPDGTSDYFFMYANTFNTFADFSGTAANYPLSSWNFSDPNP